MDLQWTLQICVKNVNEDNEQTTVVCDAYLWVHITQYNHIYNLFMSLFS